MDRKNENEQKFTYEEDGVTETMSQILDVYTDGFFGEKEDKETDSQLH